MHSRTSRSSLIIAVCVALLLVGGAVAAEAATSNKGATKKGGSWLSKESKRSLRQFPGVGFRADAVSAIAAARKTAGGLKSSADDALVDSIKSNAVDYNGESAGATAKLILAAVAAGERPRCFPASQGKLDLYATLNSFYNEDDKHPGRYGNTAYDQALSMLALKAAHIKIPKSAVKYLKKQRGGNGWNFALSTGKGDDVESTGLAIEALRAAGVSKKDKALKTAFKWMYNQRNNAGGFNPTTEQGLTQANTTAYAIRAGTALGKNLKKSKAELRTLQQRSGWFKSLAGDTANTNLSIATSDSVIALSGRHYPVSMRSKADKSCL